MGFLKVAAREFLADRVPRLAAALSFYTLLALAPMVILIVALVGQVYGADAARQGIVQQVGDLVGPASAQLMNEVLANADRNPPGGVASAIGLVMLVVGATGVGAQIQDALNTVWGIRAAKHHWLRRIVQKRLLSLAFLAALAFLLVVSLLLNALLHAAWGRVGAGLGAWLVAADAAATLAVMTLLLALAYKVLPDCRVPWRHVWLGAVVAAALFGIGRSALGLYLGRSAVATAFGAAGGLAVFLVWVYYSGIIFFAGAELTQAQFAVSGRALVPKPGAAVTAPGERPAAAATPPALGGGTDVRPTGPVGLLVGALATGLGIGLLGRGLRRR